MGPERVCDLAREKFFWTHMAKDIEHHIHHKCKCLLQKRPNTNKVAPLSSITSSEPLELISINFLHLEELGGYQYILTVVDNFSRYLQCYATRKNKAVTAARHLYNDYFTRFGMFGGLAPSPRPR